MKKILLLVFGLTCLANVNAQVVDSLNHKEYLEYKKRALDYGFILKSEEEWNNRTAPGSYLIKAKNKIIGGFVLSTVSAAGIAANSAFNSDNDSYMPINYAMGGLSLVALILEISGVVDIGKAGVGLNENGIGIKVKF